MGGGLMQLVAYGAQDIYLTGNPQITFFKVVYRRHTNFSMESIEQTFDGSLAWGSRVSCTISRNGDLVHKMYIQYVPNDIIDITKTGGRPVAPKLGCGILKEVELEIGGQMIDRHYSHWLSAYEDLTQENETRVFNKHTSKTTNYLTAGQHTRYQLLTGNIGRFGRGQLAETVGNCEHFMPLQFWFCRNVGLALPLIALQYHEVKLYWTLPTEAELTAGTDATRNVSNCKLFVDYIYLDTDERRRFAQVSHEYLIEQLQYEEHALSASLELNFNHPVKELVWGGKPSANAAGESVLTTFHRLQKTTSAVMADPESKFNTTLKLNGHERFAPRGATYFSRQQIFDYHTGPGSLADMDALSVYSFALKPEEHQPSGTCNFSRIDSAILQFNTAPDGTPGTTSIDAIRVYAVNYNVLRIMSGMGGLAYSN
jgi:hypothetical protein